MTVLARSILEHFAEAFPESAHYRGGRRLRLARWSERFPGIERDIEERESFLEAVEELEALSLVSVKWTRFRERTELEAIYLEAPERMYELLGRHSPETIRSDMLSALDSAQWRQACTAKDEAHGEAARAIYELLRAELETRHPVALDDAAGVRDLAILLSAPPQLFDSLPLRALSVRLFSDSKRLERLLEAADRLSRRAVGYTLSESLGLLRSYPEATVALRGTIRFGDAMEHRWELAGEPVILPVTTVALIREIELPRGDDPHRILSVENKETFHVLASKLYRVTGSQPQYWSGLVYTAGHPNPAVTETLRKLHAAGAELHHFGDMDPDGLLIAAEIAEAVGVEVHPAFMSPALYLRYLSYGYPLSQAVAARLSAGRERLPVTLSLLADEIIARRIGVEQEVIDLDAPDT